jgi:hypothetical protein
MHSVRYVSIESKHLLFPLALRFYCSHCCPYPFFLSFYLFTCFDHCRLKIFAPIAILAFAVLVPVNWTNDGLELAKVEHSDIDKLSISNIPVGSKRLALDDLVHDTTILWGKYWRKSQQAWIH